MQAEGMIMLSGQDIGPTREGPLTPGLLGYLVEEEERAEREAELRRRQVMGFDDEDDEDEGGKNPIASR